IIGGSSWIALSDLLPEQKIYLEYTILFFFIYSFLLYLLIIRNPERIRVYYITTFFLDLIFLYWLVRLTGGYQSVFHLAFLLLIALHAFYFGLRFGVIVATLASGTYLFSGDLSQLRGDWVDISLRIGFFYLTGTTLGLLSRKEARDRAQIYQLNRELVHERNKLSQILEGIHAGLILLDKERQILWMNRISKEWFGNWDESQRPICHELIWHGNGECANCPTLRCIEKGEIQSGEVEYFRNGEVRYFRITSAPLKNEQGELEKVLELFQDITKEKEIQYHLIQTSKLAAVGELSSSIAHEINNPLGSIAICVQDIAEMLAAPYTVENKFDTDIRQNLEHIRSEIQRCKRITTGLLNLARGSEHKKAPTDVNQLVQNVVLLVNYKARKEKKELRLQLAKDLPLISADADGLSQVILNLLLNAIEFSP
ncbi:MAG: PAS domain-containing protein, partial [Methanobacteriota archaeon]